ncbi:DNA cytosine methyltransferase [Vibrio parahaemolyticus]|uniref:DNA cytosine methyltransferase n=1 Tax=Vibrio parahaemolyticus TaxID=670 RepID=UPI00111E96D4|nr:DNA cytosine methyltransferase [Vibrio parahaemolyticus]EGR0437963.1 DNA cytosine methyltransferase [Vibrio parahaemolyticus]EGR3329453.1 DNA cytosine methyltransferase [Vibrio parahaemolyticus]MDZ5208976.1 DNA cytosine methyltransferase [Vibrio parahaemolyticus]MQC34073.1 DNA cytosine methyltransferase [Vibrio parahaemolyticus]MQC43387.1 DNA cytosine methyltransferase [Vibrio parahaemolyticus]
MILPGEIVVDNFAGGGGASTGMELGLNRHVDIAINHDPAAIDMHKVNHPETKHYCESVWDVDPIEACEGRPVGLAWFSPDCKHFSKAKGNRPVDKNIRGLAWVAVRWAAMVPVRMMMLENVEEFMTWGPVVETESGKFKPCPDRKGETFDAFVKVLTDGLNEDHPAWEEIKTALGDDFPHYDKLQTGLGYALDFKVLHACDYGAPTTRKRFFMVARNDGQPIEWPAKTHGPDGSGLKPFASAADIIDWSIPVKSIFNRKRPLAEKTMERIAKGLDKFVFSSDAPFVVPESCSTPFVTECANASSQRNMPANEPLRTICAQVKGGHFALVTSHMVKMRGTNIGHGTNEPVHTISAGGFHIGEVRAFLLKYYGTSYGESCDSPIGTVTTKDRFGLVTVKGEKYQIVDIGMRMLEPHELFAAQGFPENYQISHSSDGKKLSKASQVARCGNAVCPPVAQALVEANVTAKTISKAA